MARRRKVRGRHYLTREEQLKGARKLVKNPKIKRNKKFYNALQRFIKKYG